MNYLVLEYQVFEIYRVKRDFLIIEVLVCNIDVQELDVELWMMY